MIEKDIYSKMFNVKHSMKGTIKENVEFKIDEQIGQSKSFELILQNLKYFKLNL